MKEHQHSPSQKRWWQRRWVKIIAALIVAGGIVFACVLEYVIRNAAPILRKRVIETLSERFNAPVELDSLNISMAKGLQVTGSGLRIHYSGPANATAPGSAAAQAAGQESSQAAGQAAGHGPVLISVKQFEFRSTLKSLLHGHMHVAMIAVDGVVIDLPVGEERKRLLEPMQDHGAAGSPHRAKKPKLALIVDRIVCRNVKLIIEVANPKKQPHEFDISHLVLDKTDGALSYNYHAQLTNPVPRGVIDATGHLGPWNTESPRESPISGDYTFAHADLNTIKGIGGTLSSTGHFAGVINRITVDGTTETPDFSLDISRHPLPLKTKFHAYVDGTSGDTTLDPVHAVLGETPILCRGTIEDLKHVGHDIMLDAVVTNGRMRDVLELGMKTPEPMMHGVLALKATIHIPPGKQRVSHKLELAGEVEIHQLSFTNPKVQNELDDLSLRAQGKPKEVKQASGDPAIAQNIAAQSTLKTNFALANSKVTFKAVDFALPGATINMDGVYDMQGDAFDFKGHVRTEATASQMTTGWKSFLLKAADPFLKKHGAGVELPISITGSKNDVHFGLAFWQADKSPAEIQQDMNTKRAAGTLVPKKKHKHEDEQPGGATAETK